MAISSANLKFYKSETVGDTGTNGGRMSATQITSGAAANLFPGVQEAERVAGGTKLRKMFCKVANDADETLFTGRVYQDKNTDGDDEFSFFAATQNDTQADVTGTEQHYGTGALTSNVSAGAVTLDVTVEPGQAAIFQIGMLVRISDKADITSGTGNEEFVTLSDASAVADVVTLTFSPALSNDFLASNTRVSSVYEYGDVSVVVNNLTVTSAGDGDFTIDGVLGDNIGSVEETWTLTFTSATAFDISGANVGSQGTGSTGAGASPNNADFSKPYFVLDETKFSGTFAAADTIVFQTHPAAVPIWVERIVPAAATPASSNSATFVLRGETA